MRILLIIATAAFLFIGVYARQTEAIIEGFHLIPADSPSVQQQTSRVEVDNCTGRLMKPTFHHAPFMSGGLGVDNLKINGGEPFTSIRKAIQALYGPQADSQLILETPARSKRQFTITGTMIFHRGQVRGVALEGEKVYDDLQVWYTYPFLKEVEVSDVQALPCD